MALDGQTTGETNLGWPGDTGGTFTNWAAQLVEGNYLSTNDLCKLLSAAGRITTPGRIPEANNNAILVYAVSTNSATNCIFLSTANFTNRPGGEVTFDAAVKPYGDKEIVIFYKGKTGAIFDQRKTNTRSTKVEGSYAPLCR